MRLYVRPLCCMYIPWLSLTYCLTTWSQVNTTTLKPLESLYKQSLKIDKKSVHFLHCSIQKTPNMLSWDNLIKYVDVCLMFKTINSLSSPLKLYVNVRTTAHRPTRAGERADCSQSVFSFTASRERNSIPSIIRRLDNIHMVLLSFI